ncbi:MAG: gamma-glutamylcyclotransferase family protein [Rhodospirillales bacterium]
MEFFFYGTLMDDDVLSRVIGRRLPPDLIEEATLRGYQRVYVAKAFYPVLVPDPEGTLDGLVVGGLAPVEVERIFAFEDDGYTAQALSVTGARRGETLAVGFMPGDGMKMTPRIWRYEDWRRRHKRLYMQRIWGKA